MAYQIATIAANGTLSDAVDVGDEIIVGIDLPTIDSAAVTFQASRDGVTFRDVYDSDGTTQTTLGTHTGNRFIEAPTALAGAQVVKVELGASQTSGAVEIGIVSK